MIAAIRRAESRTLVVRGDAGVGKTALLEYALESATDLRVLRAVGVESEMELPFAVLHQLCAPMLDGLNRLPTPQREALSIAFGRTAGPPPDRFLVGLAVLSLLSEIAQECPLLCVVDDLQWLDRATAQTLTFVARRLQAEAVGLVFGAREVGAEFRGLPQLEVLGLHNGDARALLGSVVGFLLDERVRDRIVAETRGNPLALLELLSAFEVATPLVEYVAPYQTVCNYWNYYWTAISEHVSEDVGGGTGQRTNLKSGNSTQDNRLTDTRATARSTCPPGQDPNTGQATRRATRCRRCTARLQPAIDAQGNADCRSASAAT